MIGIGLPVLFCIGLVLAIAFQSSNIQPKYGFVYSITRTSDAPVVASGTTVPVTAKSTQTQTFYNYNVLDNTSHTITADQLKTYKLDLGPSSPDGYIVRYEYVNSGIFELFGSGSRSENGWYIEKDSARKRLTGIPEDSYQYYQGNFQLIGWIQ